MEDELVKNLILYYVSRLPQLSPGFQLSVIQGSSKLVDTRLWPTLRGRGGGSDSLGFVS